MKQTGRDILLVEDSEMQSAVLARFLGKHGYHVRCAPNGREGLELLRSWTPDLIVADVQMPVMDGFAMCSRVKADPDTKDIPVVLFTSLSNVDDVILGVNAGADYYLTKPWNETFFLAQMKRMLEKGTDGGAGPEPLLDMEFEYGGRTHAVNGSARRIMNLMCSLYDNAVDQKKKVIEAQRELKRFNQRLEQMVQERTEALTREIRERKAAQETLEKTYQELHEAHRRLQQSESRLIQAEKMKALGTMVAGVAHELNNPMMGIINFVQYCLRHTDAKQRTHSVLLEIEQEARRCADIVRNLLTFSRRGATGEKARCRQSLPDVLHRVVRLLSYRIESEGVSLRVHVADGLPEMVMAADEIQQVFLNLLQNGLDALQESSRKELTVTIGSRGKDIFVGISDTGCGIPEGLTERIFDPFFTTKAPGKGTGLGLSLCLGIIDKHGGACSCRSEPGRGTTFEITFPAEGEQGGIYA